MAEILTGKSEPLVYFICPGHRVLCKCRRECLVVSIAVGAWNKLFLCSAPVSRAIFSNSRSVEQRTSWFLEPRAPWWNMFIVIYSEGEEFSPGICEFNFWGATSVLFFFLNRAVAIVKYPHVRKWFQTSAWMKVSRLQGLVFLNVPSASLSVTLYLFFPSYFESFDVCRERAKKLGFKRRIAMFHFPFKHAIALTNHESD